MNTRLRVVVARAKAESSVGERRGKSVKKRFIIKAREGIVNKRFMQIYPVAIFPVEKRQDTHNNHATQL